MIGARIAGSERNRCHTGIVATYLYGQAKNNTRRAPMLIVDIPMPITGEMQVCIRSDGYVLFPDDDVPFFKVTKARELVRCGKCIYRSQTLRGSWCTNSKSCCHGCLVRKDFFCADGERKDGK